MRYELTKELETGNAIIDGEHRELFNAGISLLDACGKGQGRAALDPTIKFLLNYIRRNDFKAFGWYRIVLGVLVILFFSL